MKILITNDDGIRSEGLLLLAEWAKKLGDVTVIAPALQQSGSSHGINIQTAFACEPAYVIPGVRGFKLDASPADCVRYATCGLGEHFDLLLAGVNCGLNTGHDIAYSATCAAIFEGAYWGIPSLAFSTVFESIAGARQSLDRVWKFLQKRKLFDHNLIYNINFPLKPQGIRITRQKDAPYYLDHFEEVKKGFIIGRGYSAYQGTSDLTVDLDAVMNGYISISPLTVERTAEKAWKRLRRMRE